MIIPLNDREAKIANVRYVEGWNAALEHAAIDLQKSYPDNVSTNAFCAAIRSLKK